MSRLAEVFRRAREQRRAAFVAYVTAGDPSAGGTETLARALDRAGTDVLELGVPFTDPIADGPVIQRASARALAAGTTLGDVLEIAARIRASTSLALVLFSYVNPLYRRGIAKAASDARDAGIDGVLLTDVPPEEADEIAPRIRGAGLDTIFLVSPTSPPSRMRRAARLSSGFLYVVSRAGTTGARDGLPPDVPETVARARRAAGRLPIAIGFGIATPEAARRAASLADGVVVGSALVAAAERDGGPNSCHSVETLARKLRDACRR